MDDISELLNKQEELVQELRDCFEPAGETFQFDCIRHPLLYSVPHFSQMNAMCNARLKFIKKEVEKAKHEHNWSRFLLFHERPHRIEAFAEYCEMMPDVEYWQMLGWVWTDSENIWQNLVLWKTLFRSSRPYREHFMQEEDRRAFDELPGELQVYRGCIFEKNADGFSWTLSQEKATWFAKRFGRNGVVLKKDIEKSEVFAYTNSRNEQEIILLNPTGGGGYAVL